MDTLRRLFGRRRPEQAYTEARASADSTDDSTTEAAQFFIKTLKEKGVNTLIINDGYLETKRDPRTDSSRPNLEDARSFMRAILKDCADSSFSIAVISKKPDTFFDKLGLDASSLAGRNFLGQFFYTGSRDEVENNRNKSAAIGTVLQRHKRACCFIYDRNLPELIPLLLNEKTTVCEGNDKFIFNPFGISSCSAITEKLRSPQKSSESPSLSTTQP